MKKIIFILAVIPAVAFPQDPLRTNIARAQRRTNAFIVRNTATRLQSNRNLFAQPTNGDEQRYPDKRGSFGKSLAQLDTGFINVDAFNQMVLALITGNPSLFNQITMGTSPVERRLVDPQSSYAFNLDGGDGWVYSMPAAPALASAETAGEMVELYWHALLRDVPFNAYATNPLAASAITDLNRLTDFRGPRMNGVVTPQTLFRGDTPGDLIGPFVSQFLYLPVPYGPGPNFNGSGALPIAYQEQVVPLAGIINDFMTTFPDWFAIQQGNFPTTSIMYTSTRTFIRNERDLGDYVHQDMPAAPYINAALILLNFGSDALDQNNPYINNPTQESFVTYNLPDIVYLIGIAAETALRAAWYQKWLVHRRARPEFVGFLANQQKSGVGDFSINQQLINSNALTQTFATFGSYFLPQAYPEGSPTHPSYPAGHATVAGACVTVLKAFFNQNFVIPSPVQPNSANTLLVAYAGTALTVENELNKLGANIAIGRDMAGVHYRSDGIQGMLLGEQVALALFQDESFSRHIPFNGFTLTKFDGTTVTVGARQVPPLL